jgi:hypothetical protein
LQQGITPPPHPTVPNFQEQYNRLAYAALRQGIVITPDSGPAPIATTPAILDNPENENENELDYCGVNVTDVNDEASLYFASQNMATLTDLNVVPLPRTVNH